jgi:hypothetical protein
MAKNSLNDAIKSNGGRVIEKNSKTGHEFQEKKVTSIIGTVKELISKSN